MVLKWSIHGQKRVSDLQPSRFKKRRCFGPKWYVGVIFRCKIRVNLGQLDCFLLMLISSYFVDNTPKEAVQRILIPKIIFCPLEYLTLSIFELLRTSRANWDQNLKKGGTKSHISSKEV